MSQATKPVSQSAETQALIDKCLEVAAGDTRAYPELEHMAQARQDALTQASDNFFAGTEKQGAEFQAKFKNEIELIAKYFEGYDAAIEQILSFKADPRPELLDESAHVLAFCSAGLQSAMAAYEQRFLSEGPSKYPLINLFANLGKLVREGKAPIEGWQGTCNQYEVFYAEAIREIDNSKEKNGPGVPARRAALESIVAALQALKALTPGSSAAKFEELTRDLEQGHSNLDAAVDEFNESITSSPTPSAAINIILKTADSVLEKKIQPGVLRNLCVPQVERLQKSIGDLQLVVKASNDSTVIQEETPKMLEAMELMEEALTVLIAYCDGTASADDAVQALEDLESGTQTVHGARVNVEAHSESYGKVICPACSTPNAPAKFCAKCGASLPQMAGSDVYSSWSSTSSFQVLEGDASDSSRDMVVTDVMKDLFESCDKFLRGKLPIDELMAKLDVSQANIDSAKAELSKLHPPPIPDEVEEEERAKLQEVIDLCADSLELLNQGVEECEYGIRQIRQGAQEENQAMINEGQQFYFQGCQKIWQVKRVDDTLQAYIKEDEAANPEDAIGESYDPA